jgi:hypothetical protein
LHIEIMKPSDAVSDHSPHNHIGLIFMIRLDPIHVRFTGRRFIFADVTSYY